MRSVGALCVGAICLGVAVVVPPQRPAIGHSPAESPVTREFDRKVVMVTARSAGRSEISVLKGVSVRRLGGREFLVGEYAISERRAVKDAPWRGVSEWVPMDVVERIQVFDTLDQCDGVWRAQDPPTEMLAPQQAVEEPKDKTSSKFLIPPTNIPNTRRK